MVIRLNPGNSSSLFCRCLSSTLLATYCCQCSSSPPFKLPVLLPATALYTKMPGQKTSKTSVADLSAGMSAVLGHGDNHDEGKEDRGPLALITRVVYTRVKMSPSINGRYILRRDLNRPHYDDVIDWLVDCFVTRPFV